MTKNTRHVRKDFPVIELRIAFKTNTLQHVAIFGHNAHIACGSDQIILLVPEERISTDRGALGSQRINVTVSVNVRERHVETAGVRTQERHAFANGIVNVHEHRTHRYNFLVGPAFQISGFQTPVQHALVVAVEKRRIRKEHLRALDANPRLGFLDFFATEQKCS